MTDNSKKIVARNLVSGGRKLYDIKKRDLLAMDRRIAEELAKNEQIRRECMAVAATTFLK